MLQILPDTCCLVKNCNFHMKKVSVEERPDFYNYNYVAREFFGSLSSSMH